MTQQELGLFGQQENLIFRSRHEMVIPPEIRNLKLSWELPDADFGYIDSNDPNTVALFDPKTWRPILIRGGKNKGLPKSIPLSEAGETFALVIVRTGSRTPEESFDELVNFAAALVKKTAVKEGKIIVNEYLGTLIVVEDKGVNTTKGWRKKQLQRSKLVPDDTAENSVFSTDNLLFSFARRERYHKLVDLTKYKRIREDLEYIKYWSIKNGYSLQKYNELEDEAKSTSNPPKTKARITDMRVAFETTNIDGKIIRADLSGDTDVFPQGKKVIEEFSDLLERVQINPIRLWTANKPGDEVRLPAKCHQCGGDIVQQYTRTPGRNGYWELESAIMCVGKKHEGSPIFKHSIYHRDLTDEPMPELKGFMTREQVAIMSRRS